MGNITQIVRSIYETARSEAETQRRLRELIEYMGWKSGWETLEAYQHYFDPQRHAEIQDQLHHRYLKMSKAELAARLLAVEQKYAEQEEQWLQVNEELMTWRLRAERAETQFRHEFGVVKGKL
jgi:hypothetical protein